MPKLVAGTQIDPGSRRPSRALLITLVIVSLALVFEVDASTGAAPFQHLYYVPIVIAGLTLPRYAGMAVGVAAVVLYHFANPSLLTSRYRESDIVQIALFLAIGIVTARLADDRRQLHRLAVTDDLTGLYNLRGFEARMTHALRAVRQANTALALLVLDVDRLKSINDTHGHVAGADAVRTVGQLVGARLPHGAFACRFGGDEFVVALPRRGVQEANETAAALRTAVHEAAPTLGGIAFPPGTLSISVGLANLAEATARASDTDAEIAESLFRAADQALYVAKESGRNQVRSA